MSGTGVKGLYNIAFVATGEYISISEFIYAIEKDEKLGFKIENFQMVSNNDINELRATFNIKNVAIDENSLK